MVTKGRNFPEVGSGPWELTGVTKKILPAAFNVCQQVFSHEPEMLSPPVFIGTLANPMRRPEPVESTPEPKPLTSFASNIVGGESAPPAQNLRRPRRICAASGEPAPSAENLRRQRRTYAVSAERAPSAQN